MKPSCRFRAFPAVILLLSAAPHFAQEAPRDKAPSPDFRSTTRAVLVDVVVTKGNDEPVSTLPRGDFQILEDGKPQTLDFFEEHTGKALPAGAVAPLPAMPPNVYTNVPPVPESDAVNVLLFDTLNSEQQDQSYVRLQMLNFLKSMEPGTRAAIFVLGSKLRFIQGFTSDSSRLVAALNDKKNSVSPEKDPSYYSSSDAEDDKEEVATLQSMLGSGHSSAGIEAGSNAQAAVAGIQMAQRMQMTFEALNYVARYLGGIPGRKNLIWFASSFPVTVFPTTAQRQQMSNERVYASAVRETADLLTVAKVAVYPVNAQGMLDNHLMDASGFTRPGMGDYNAANAAHADTIMAMEQLAGDTGGKAYYNTNDLSNAVRHAINDGSHYYTLVYTPSNKKLDGHYRHIEVKLNSGHYKLSYRRGYNADAPAVMAAQPATDSDPLRPLLMRGLPSVTQLLYGVRVTPTTPQPAANAQHAGQNAKLTGPFTRYSVDFLVRWSDVTFTSAANHAHAGKIQVGLMAYDRTGKAVNWQGGTQEMNLSPTVFAAVQKSGIPAHIEIDLPSTDVYLETGIYDWGTGKAGTLEIPVHPETASAAAMAPGH